MVEKQAILDHLYLHRDEDPVAFLERQELLSKSDMGEIADTSYTFEPLFKILRYFVTHELIGSTNTPETDYKYFKHIYMMLFNNEVNKIRLDAYDEARKQLKNEFKRRMRDDPDLIRKVNIQSKTE